MKTDRFYSYDPDDGFSDHSTAEAAQAATERVLEDYRDAAEAVLEWSGDVANLHWGRLLPLGNVAGTEGTDDDGEPWTNYHLAAQPDELAQLRSDVAALREEIDTLSSTDAMQALIDLRQVLRVERIDRVPEGYADMPSEYRKNLAQLYRALAWALEHDARPPHAGDEVTPVLSPASARGVCGDACSVNNECGRLGCQECQQ